MEFNTDGSPDRRIRAQAARLRDGEWVLYDVKLWDLQRGNIAEATAQQMDQLRLQSDLTQDRIVDSFGKPEYIPIWGLREFITQLEQAGFSARRYDMWYQMELARPLFLMSLVMVAAAFTMRPARLSNTGLSVLTAVLLGFGLHYVRNLAQILGENGEIPVALAAWAPPVAFFLLATGIVLHMEDG
ncbi:MAG: LptF/LptG family permease [Pseudomonadota bacterium]